MQWPARAWLRKVEREYTHWEWAARKGWEDSMIATNYLWWARVSSKYQAMDQVHMRQVQRQFKQAAHRVHRDAPIPRSKQRRQKWENRGTQPTNTNPQPVTAGYRMQ